MSTETLERLLPIMNVMAQVEGAVAEFYAACAEAFPLNKKFWAQLAAEEIWHADAVNELMLAVNSDPQMFVVGDTSPLEALESFIARIKTNLKHLQTGHLTEDKALLVAYLIENTFIEGKYAEIIRPSGTCRSKMLEELSSDSIKHRDRVIRRMREEKMMTRITGNTAPGSD